MEEREHLYNKKKREVKNNGRKREGNAQTHHGRYMLESGSTPSPLLHHIWRPGRLSLSLSFFIFQLWLLGKGARERFRTFFILNITKERREGIEPERPNII